MQIWKFDIQPGEFEVEIPEGGHIIHVGEQLGDPMMWVAVHPNADKKTFKFISVATGEDFGMGMDQYAGTFKLGDGLLIFHLFLLTTNNTISIDGGAA